jgi:hypothetical protein
MELVLSYAGSPERGNWWDAEECWRPLEMLVVVVYWRWSRVVQVPLVIELAESYAGTLPTGIEKDENWILRLQEMAEESATRFER